MTTESRRLLPDLSEKPHPRGIWGKKQPHSAINTKKSYRIDVFSCPQSANQLTWLKNVSIKTYGVVMYDPCLQKALNPLVSSLAKSKSLFECLQKLTEQNPQAKEIDSSLNRFPDMFKNDLDGDLFTLMCLVQTCAQSIVYHLQKEASDEKRLPTWVLENQAIRCILDNICDLDESKKQTIKSFLCNKAFEYAIKHSTKDVSAVHEHIAKACVPFELDDAHMYEVCKQLAYCKAIVNTSLSETTKEANRDLRLIQNNWMTAHLSVLANIEKSLESTYKGHIALNKILAMIGSNEKNSQEASYLSFFKNVDHILSYIQNQHIKMLEHYKMFGDEDKDRFKDFQKNIKKVLLTVIHYGAKKTNNSKKLIEFYEKELNDNSLALRDFSCYGNFLGQYFFDSELLSQAKIEVNRSSLESLQDELQQFRRNYLVRFSKEKVRTKAKQKIEEYQSGHASSPAGGRNESPLNTVLSKVLEDGYQGEINEEEGKLLQLTAFHGTHSTLLANLSQTDNCLVPSGKASKLNITPFSGELREGAGEGGINAYAISTVPLADVNTAMGYTQLFHFNYDNLKSKAQHAMQFFEALAKKKSVFTKIDDMFTNSFGGESWLNLAMDLERAIVLQSNDASLFSEHEWKEMMTNKLPAFANKIQADFEAFQKTSEFKSRMPREEDPEGSKGYIYHDYYYWHHFIAARSAINALMKLVHFKPSKMNSCEVELLKSKPFGLLVSTDSHTQGLGDLSASERKIVSDLHFGTNIKAVFVEPNTIEYLTQRFSSIGINNVTVHNQETLTRLHRHEVVLSSYFADVLSKKKLKAVLEENKPYSYDIKRSSEPLKPVQMPANLSSLAEIRMQKAAIKDYVQLKKGFFTAMSLLSFMISIACAVYYFAAPMSMLAASIITGFAGCAALYKANQISKSGVRAKSTLKQNFSAEEQFRLHSDTYKQGYRCGLKADSMFEYAKSFIEPVAYSPQYYLARRHAACKKQQVDKKSSRPDVDRPAFNNH